MKKYFIKISLLAILFAGAFISCSDDDNEDPWVQPTFGTTGAFILNEGAKGTVVSQLSYYDTEKKILTTDVFKNQNNGLELGDGAQDILIYGAKMYITVTESNMIFVTNLEGKLLSEGKISTAATPYKQPRHLAAHNGNVYVDFYSGHLAKIDTTKLEVVNQLSIPEYSERMTIVDNELYIANSQQKNVPGNTVTVVNLNSFKVEKDPISVRVNPSIITSDKVGNVFVLSWGIWNDPTNKSALTKINSKTHKAEIIGEDAASFIAVQKNRLLLAKNVYPITKFSQYDIFAEKLMDTPFITVPEAEKEELDKLYHISVDPNNDDIYISTSDYQTTGSMYIFSGNGEYKSHFKTGGINPQKVVFLTAQTN